MKITTKELAKYLGCTVQAANKYRRRAEERYQTSLGSPDPIDARITVFSPDEVELIRSLSPQPKSSVTETQALEGGALVQVRNLEPSIAPPTHVNNYVFLVFDSTQQEHATEQSRKRTASNFNAFRAALRNQIGRQGRADAVSAVGDYVANFEDELNSQLGKFTEPIQDAPTG